MLRLARAALGVPVAEVSTPSSPPSRCAARFAERVLESDDVLIVADAAADARFANDPSVNARRGVRFYAGVALRDPHGRELGVLSLLDFRPRELEPPQREALADLAVLASQALEAGGQPAEPASSAEYQLVPDLTADKVLDRVPEGVVILDSAGLILAGNAPLRHLFGVTDTAVGHHVADFLDEVGEEDVARWLAQVQQQGRPALGVRLTGVRADGRQFPLEVVISPAKGSVSSRFVAVVRDIGVTRQLEQAVLERETRLQMLADEVSIGIVVIDRWGRFLSANPYFQRLLGYGERELQTGPMNWRDVIHPDDREPHGDLVSELTVGKLDRLHVEKRFLRRDGSVFWGSITLSVVRGGDGEPVHYIGLVEDIDDRKRAAQEMEAALRAQRQANELLARVNADQSAFISAVSHEFRTTLTGIRGFAELLRDYEVTPDEVRSFAGEIHREASRLNGMIQEMLDLERMESGQAHLSVGPVDVNQLLTLAAERVRFAAPELRVRVELADDVGVVHADSERLVQAFAHILGNAANHTPAGGIITISSRRRPCGVQVTVADTGPGIPEDALERIFERYARVEQTSARSLMGLGLGLAIVRQIANMHGGRVWAENIPGGGSRFVLELPFEPGRKLS